MGNHKFYHLVNRGIAATPESDDTLSLQHFVQIPPVDQFVIKGIPTVDVGEVEPLARAEQARQGIIIEVLD
jgi:hypothetical protein